METVKQELRDFKKDICDLVAPLNAAVAKQKEDKETDIQELLLQHNRAINYLKNFSNQLLDDMICMMSKNEQLLDVLIGQKKANEINAD